jgi:hypothetical protein
MSCTRILQAAAPARPIERGLPTAALLAQVIASTYADHSPLCRQEGIYPRSGVELPRATLASWVGESARLLDPLVSALERYVMSATKVHADDTPTPVLCCHSPDAKANIHRATWRGSTARCRPTGTAALRRSTTGCCGASARCTTSSVKSAGALPRYDGLHAPSEPHRCCSNCMSGCNFSKAG